MTNTEIIELFRKGDEPNFQKFLDKFYTKETEYETDEERESKSRCKKPE